MGNLDMTLLYIRQTPARCWSDPEKLLELRQRRAARMPHALQHELYVDTGVYTALKFSFAAPCSRHRHCSSSVFRGCLQLNTYIYISYVYIYI